MSSGSPGALTRAPRLPSSLRFLRRTITICSRGASGPLPLVHRFGAGARLFGRRLLRGRTKGRRIRFAVVLVVIVIVVVVDIRGGVAVVPVVAVVDIIFATIYVIIYVDIIVVVVDIIVIIVIVVDIVVIVVDAIIVAIRNLMFLIIVDRDAVVVVGLVTTVLVDQGGLPSECAAWDGVVAKGSVPIPPVAHLHHTPIFFNFPSFSGHHFHQQIRTLQSEWHVLINDKPRLVFGTSRLALSR